MFQTLLVQPIYNAFVALLGVMPQGDVGLAIIALTLVMRVVLYPVFSAAIRTQVGMQAMQGELDELKDKYKDDRERQAREQMALFKKYKVNPLAGFAALFIQLAVLIALYFALFHAQLPAIDTAFLYSFVHAPAAVSTSFFGLIDLLAPHHVLLALVVGVTQYLSIRITLRRTPLRHAPGTDRHAVERMQQNLMLYAMPFAIMVTSYFFAAAVGIYFAASNIFSIGQEWLITRRLQKTSTTNN